MHDIVGSYYYMVESANPATDGILIPVLIRLKDNLETKAGIRFLNPAIYFYHRSQQAQSQKLTLFLRVHDWHQVLLSHLLPRLQ